MTGTSCRATSRRIDSIATPRPSGLKRRAGKPNSATATSMRPDSSQASYGKVPEIATTGGTAPGECRRSTATAPATAVES